VIAGRVVAGREAVIPISLLGAQGQGETINAIVDTGFTGFLTLPLQQIARLGFAYEGIIDARLGDGRAAEFDMFAGAVVWDEQVRAGIVLAVEGTPLIGMALLRGSRVTLDVADGGVVTIERLP
jgi:predicted aspartyl protease